MIDYLSYIHNLSSCEITAWNKQKKNHDWPGFELMISAMPVQRSIFQFSSAFLLIFRLFRSLGIFLKSYLVKGEVSRFASALDSLVVEVLVSRLFSSNSALLADEVCHSASFAGLRSLSFFNHSSWLTVPRRKRSCSTLNLWVPPDFLFSAFSSWCLGWKNQIENNSCPQMKYHTAIRRFTLDNWR